MSKRQNLSWILEAYVLTYSAASHVEPWLPGSHKSAVNYAAQCVQPDTLVPKVSPKLSEAFELISSPSFRNASIARLSGAVKIKTETFDDLGEIGVDKIWKVFYGFYEYPEEIFPLVHEKLIGEKANQHAGSAVYSVELLEAKFEPKRTVLLANGFDEETFGYHGAKNLCSVIRERYGDDGLAIVVDEGATFEEAWGTTFAKPGGTSEKGSTDVTITIGSPVGHSSIPHDHTSVGFLSEVIYLIESTQYPTRLYDENPHFTQLQCGVAFSPNFDPKLREFLDKRLQSRGTCNANKHPLALEAAKLGPGTKYLLQTSQAVDIISGGAKINALPECAQDIVNQRVNVREIARVFFDHLAQVAAHVADKHGLKLQAFDGVEELCSIILSHNTYLDEAGL
ncbi:hypothetical protein PZA11_000003 [Diplocarpon coronariae]